MRTRLARRGGPGGRCHPWLKLSKSHSELQKLIPLYFPPRSATIPSECDSNCVNVNTTDSYSASTHLTDTLQNQRDVSPSVESPSTESNDNGSTSGSDHRVFDIKPPRDFTWNVDFPSTNKLHEKMNIGLIYESLTMSPIHWKCVPQIHGLPDKHCSALCGVIIREKRKKPKRIHDLPACVENVTTWVLSVGRFVENSLFLCLNYFHLLHFHVHFLLIRYSVVFTFSHHFCYSCYCWYVVHVSEKW